MANLKAKQEILDLLTDADRAVLLKIYQHRCLTEQLLEKYIYREQPERASDRVQWMVRENLLECADYGMESPALFLTAIGVRTVRAAFAGRCDLRKDAAAVLEAAKSANDLRMKPHTISHQLGLNAFVLEFEERARGLEYEYYDEKYMPPCSPWMMPDGMIEFEDCIVLLEEDMGSERGWHLARKWSNYRKFLNEPGGYYRGRKIIMFFILDNVQVIFQRKNTVWASMVCHLIDRLDGTFEAYADSPGILMDILVRRIGGIRNENAMEREARLALTAFHGFSFAPAPLSDITRLDYGAYIRRLTAKRRILIADGKPQEYLLDIWSDGNLSEIHKIVRQHQTEMIFRSRAGRAVPYLVVVPDERWLYNVTRICAIRETPGVYFTTVERLQKLSFQEALFRIDPLGNLYHFDSLALEGMIFEKKLRRR